VTVHVSKGPDLVAVPDLKGKTLTQAQSMLEKAGLQVGLLSGWKNAQSTVRAQDPPKGQKVLRNTQVDLSFGKDNCILGILCG
jgi:serine/threonine-protein kinase